MPCTFKTSFWLILVLLCGSWHSARSFAAPAWNSTRYSNLRRTEEDSGPTGGTVQLVTGQLLLQTSNANNFVKEKKVPDILLTSIAIMADVDTTTVYNLNTSMLSEIVGSSENEGIVDVTFDIIILPIAGTDADTVVQEFNGKSSGEAGATIGSNLLVEGLMYNVRVNFHFATATTGDSSEKAPAPAPVEEGGAPTFVIIGAVVACISLTAVVGALFYIRWLSIRAKGDEGRRSFLIRDLVRKRTSEFHTGGGKGGDDSSNKKKAQRTSQDFASVAGQLAHSKGVDLLVVPEMISFQGGQAIRRLAQAMVSDIACHNAPVFISYATGHRELDATGFGPGACYAAAVLKAFHDEGVQCFSGLMIPTALYSSKPCLKEIYAAQKSKIEIIPLRFEVDLPPIEKQWPQIKPTDMDGILMLTEVQKEYCLLEATPKYPKTMLSDPHMLDELVADVKSRLADPEHFQKRKQKLAAQAQAQAAAPPVDVLGARQPKADANRYPSDDGWGHGGGLGGASDPWKLSNLLADGASNSLDAEQDPLLNNSGGGDGPPQRAAKFRKDKNKTMEPSGFAMDFTQASATSSSATAPPARRPVGEAASNGLSRPFAMSDTKPGLQRKRPKAAGGGAATSSAIGSSLQKNNSEPPRNSVPLGKATSGVKSASVPERKRPKAPPPSGGGQDF